MLCTKCGANYESAAQSFCVQCGTPLYQESSIDKSKIKNKSSFDVGESVYGRADSDGLFYMGIIKEIRDGWAYLEFFDDFYEWVSMENLRDAGYAFFNMNMQANRNNQGNFSDCKFSGTHPTESRIHVIYHEDNQSEYVRTGQVRFLPDDKAFELNGKKPFGTSRVVPQEKPPTVTDQGKKTKGTPVKNPTLIRWIIGSGLVLGFLGLMGLLIASGALSSDTLANLKDAESLRVVINEVCFKYVGSITELKGYGNFLLIVIVVCSVALFIIRKCRTFFEDRCLTGPVHIINQILFILVCIVEMVYSLSKGTDLLGFCDPSMVGWIQAGIRFVGFAAIVYNQFMTFMDNMVDLQYNAYVYVNLSIGLFAWPIAIVATFIVSFIDESLISFVWILFALAQLIQMIIILVKVIPKGGIFKALYMIFAYCIGAIGTAFIAYVLLLVVLIIMIVLAVLSVASLGTESSGSSSPARCPNCGRRLNRYNECSNCGIGVTS